MKSKCLPKPPLYFYVHPYENESFNSWLNRLSCSHYNEIKDFLSITGHPCKSKIDFDIVQNHAIVKWIQFHGPLNEKEIIDLTFYSSNNSTYSSLFKNGFLHWLLPHQIKKLYDSKKLGLQYCPKCWSTDDNPYFRLHWRLSYFFFCSKCFSYLVRRCQECGYGVTYSQQPSIDFRLDPEISFRYCFHCKFDLSSGENEPLSDVDKLLANRMLSIFSGERVLPCSIEEYLFLFHFFASRSYREYSRRNNYAYLIQKKDQCHLLNCEPELRALFFNQAYDLLDFITARKSDNLSHIRINKAYWLRGFKSPYRWYMKHIKSL